MSDVIRGLVQTPPGTSFYPPPGKRCDKHSDRLAVARIQSETDAFGAEMVDCCQECAIALQSALHAPKAVQCDRCDTPQLDCMSWRNPDEGVAGRVYMVCSECRKAFSVAAREETPETTAEQDVREEIARIGEARLVRLPEGHPDFDPELDDVDINDDRAPLEEPIGSDFDDMPEN